MIPERIRTLALDVIWCIIVPLSAFTGYLGLGTVGLLVIGEPILATALLDIAVIVLIVLARTARPARFAYDPAPARSWSKPPFPLVITGLTALAFIAGQAVAQVLYTQIGSAGFDRSVDVRQDADILLLLLLTLVAAPLAEELLFRGLVYPQLRRRVGIIAATAVNSLAFALMHGNIIQVTATLPLALVLSLVYERTRRLAPCVLIHLAFNLAAILTPAAIVEAITSPMTAAMFLLAFAISWTGLYRAIAGSTVDDAAVGSSGPTAAGESAQRPRAV